MKVVSRRIRSAIQGLPKWSRLGLCMLSVILLVLLIVNLRLIISTAKFFSMMIEISKREGVQIDTIQDYPLDELKRVAIFVLEQPTEDRRRMIAMYGAYEQNQSDANVKFDLYVLLRLLFEIPVEHPEEDTKLFKPIWMPGPPECINGKCNLLWPLDTQDGQLVLVDVPSGYSSTGLPYNKVKDYDYFVSRFSFRSVQDLQ
jgi:hypothetical protein